MKIGSIFALNYSHEALKLWGTCTNFMSTEAQQTSGNKWATACFLTFQEL